MADKELNLCDCGDTPILNKAGFVVCGNNRCQLYNHPFTVEVWNRPTNKEPVASDAVEKAEAWIDANKLYTDPQVGDAIRHITTLILHTIGQDTLIAQQRKELISLKEKI